MDRLKMYIGILWNFVLPEKLIVQKVKHLTLAHLAEKLSPIETHSGFTALFSYKDRDVKSAIWALKYHETARMAELFGILLHSYLIDEIADRALFENFTSPLLIPIPLSKRKLRERGFNQSELIVKACAIHDCEKTLELCVTAFKRNRDTESQARMPNKRAREENVSGAFSVVDADSIKDRNVILFDDVVTTGATLKEARETLMNAGAKSVFGIAIAH